ncbi:reprolysin family zinc metalloprotease [Cryptosporidium andersoni]|uniref:Reprolysin family zinc metalloprotease n=1 Tax=Cryptosporidium andersoni TaxID=117008 RepID=A0A1J4MUB4_9CRYT|nr:reprolysin family zinc metalloprotease [Cryptosporidium andersoni]
MTIILALVGAYEPQISTECISQAYRCLQKIYSGDVIVVAVGNRTEHRKDYLSIKVKGREITNFIHSNSSYTSTEKYYNQFQIWTRSIFSILLKLKRRFEQIYSIKASSTSTLIIGLTSVDISPSNQYHFSYGQTDAENGLAIVSGYRIYKRGDTNNRLVKVLLHEYGHLMKLTHCECSCVMSIVSSLSELDERPLKFCSSCINQLLQNNESVSPKNLLIPSPGSE